jgi:hypothetical protein
VTIRNRDGVPATDDRVRRPVALHHGVVSLSWTPDAAAYRALVEYLRDAIDVYADTVLVS